MNHESFRTFIPAECSVTTREGAVDLLTKWVAEGPSSALLEVGQAFALKEFRPLREKVIGLWVDWVEGERTSKGLKCSVLNILRSDAAPTRAQTLFAGVAMIIEIEASALAKLVVTMMVSNGTFADARRCAADYDFEGLCGVINVSMGASITASVRKGLMFEVIGLIGES